MKAKTKKLLMTRASTAAALDTSTATVRRLEELGYLHPIKLTGQLGNTYYDAGEVEALTRRDGEVQLSAPPKAGVPRLRSGGRS